MLRHRSISRNQQQSFVLVSVFYCDTVCSLGQYTGLYRFSFYNQQNRLIRFCWDISTHPWSVWLVEWGLASSPTSLLFLVLSCILSVVTTCIFCPAAASNPVFSPACFSSASNLKPALQLQICHQAQTLPVITINLYWTLLLPLCLVSLPKASH